MGEYIEKKKQSRTLDSNPKVSRQAPISDILQSYKNTKFVKQDNVEEETDSLEKKTIQYKENGLKSLAQQNINLKTSQLYAIIEYAGIKGYSSNAHKDSIPDTGKEKTLANLKLWPAIDDILTKNVTPMAFRDSKKKLEELPDDENFFEKKGSHNIKKMKTGNWKQEVHHSIENKSALKFGITGENNHDYIRTVYHCAEPNAFANYLKNKTEIKVDDLKKEFSVAKLDTKKDNVLPTCAVCLQWMNGKYVESYVYNTIFKDPNEILKINETLDSKEQREIKKLEEEYNNSFDSEISKTTQVNYINCINFFNEISRLKQELEKCIAHIREKKVDYNSDNLNKQFSTKTKEICKKYHQATTLKIKELESSKEDGITILSTLSKLKKENKDLIDMKSSIEELEINNIDKELKAVFQTISQKLNSIISNMISGSEELDNTKNKDLVNNIIFFIDEGTVLSYNNLILECKINISELNKSKVKLEKESIELKEEIDKLEERKEEKKKETEDYSKARIKKVDALKEKKKEIEKSEEWLKKKIENSMQQKIEYEGKKQDKASKEFVKVVLEINDKKNKLRINIDETKKKNKEIEENNEKIEENNKKIKTLSTRDSP